MAINEWKIFRRFFKHPEAKIDVDSDLNAVYDFLMTINDYNKKINPIIKKMQDLRAKKMITENQKNDNLLEQVKVFDKLIKEYRFLEEDSDVNGYRIKKISKLLKAKANEDNIGKEWLDKINTSDDWNFNW